MKKSPLVALVFGAATLLLLAGCDAIDESTEPSSPAESAQASSTPTPAPVAQGPCGPTDGTWPYGGDVAFEQKYRDPGLRNEWDVQLQGLPTCGGGLVTSTFVVSHFEDHGNEQTISGDNSFAFMPGNNSHREDESYGTNTTLTCADDRPAVGSSTTCTVSFAAPPEEIQDFYWLLDGIRVAAWPSQVP